MAKPVTVVGVAAIEFSGPVLLAEASSVAGSGVTVWGRLRPSLTREVAQDEFRSVATALRPQHADDIWGNETGVQIHFAEELDQVHAVVRDKREFVFDDPLCQ